MRKLFLLLSFPAFLSNTVNAQIPSWVPSSGLKAWYPFSGNPNDSSGYGNNGVLHGGATYGTDRFGNTNRCFLADSVSAIDFPVNLFPLGNNERTVSVFFKLPVTSIGGIRELFAWGDNSFPGHRFGMELENDTAIGWESVGSAALCHFTADTLWHNLTVAYPSAGVGTPSLKLFVDGEQRAVTTIVSPLTTLNTVTSTIHCAGSLFMEPTFLYGWYGRLDDIGVWDRELTSCEIERMFYGPNPLRPVISLTGGILTTSPAFPSYQWIKNGTSIPGATNSSYTVTSDGTYKVAVVTPGGCLDTSLILYGHPADVNAIPGAESIRLFPNPATGIINVQSPVPLNTMILSPDGRTLGYRENVNRLDLSQLPHGIYFIELFDEHDIRIKTERVTLQ